MGKLWRWILTVCTFYVMWMLVVMATMTMVNGDDDDDDDGDDDGDNDDDNDDDDDWLKGQWLNVSWMQDYMSSYSKWF